MKIKNRRELSLIVSGFLLASTTDAKLSNLADIILTKYSFSGLKYIKDAGWKLRNEIVKDIKIIQFKACAEAEEDINK